MKERNINFSSRQFGMIQGYKLVFNKKAKDGNFGYANIRSSENDIVEGALYEFPDKEIDNLDKKEGCPNHYTRTEINVVDGKGNKLKAMVYIANQDKVLDGLSPTKEYLSHLLAAKDILIKTIMIN